MQTIETERVRTLADAGAQLLEVLPEAEYQREHLPGAICIPLTELTAERAQAELDPTEPVVVYCYDTECDLSSRGAARLDAFGFEEVYDYTGSKTEWLAMHLPYEGTVPVEERAGQIAQPAVTCPPWTELAELRDPGPGDVVLVIDEHDRVLGALRPEQLSAGSGTALEVAQPAPSSVRPSITADELARSMDKGGEGYVVVSTLDGVLIGIVERDGLVVDR
jgi:rhodanese-related sulfurtransferase